MELTRTWRNERGNLLSTAESDSECYAQTLVECKGFDSDYHFMLIEMSGDELYFQAISRTGASIDDGAIRRN